MQYDLQRFLKFIYLFIFVLEELCQCPQKCDERVPFEKRDILFHHFYGLGDADLQNNFLRKHMDVKPRNNIPETTPSGRSPRRIACKYLIPLLPSNETTEVCQKAFVSAFVISTKRVRLQREKLISSMGLNSYSSQRNLKSPSENNKLQMAIQQQHHHHQFNMNKNTTQQYNTNKTISTKSFTLPSECYLSHIDDRGIDDDDDEDFRDDYYDTSKRRLLVDDPLIPFGLVVPEGVTIAPVTATPDHDRDIAIVNNFFSNQLWKPEYIGTYS